MSLPRYYMVLFMLLMNITQNALSESELQFLPSDMESSNATNGVCIYVKVNSDNKKASVTINIKGVQVYILGESLLFHGQSDVNIKVFMRTNKTIQTMTKATRDLLVLGKHHESFQEIGLNGNLQYTNEVKMFINLTNDDIIESEIGNCFSSYYPHQPFYIVFYRNSTKYDTAPESSRNLPIVTAIVICIAVAVALKGREVVSMTMETYLLEVN